MRKLFQLFTNSFTMESHLDEILVIQDFPTVKYEGRFFHFGVDFGIIQVLKFIPLRTNDNGMSVFSSFVSRLGDLYNFS